MKKRVRNTTKYLVVMAIFLLLVNQSLGLILMKQSSSSMITLMHTRMLDISNTAAAMLDGDTLAKVTPEDEGTPGYETIMKTLTYFQDNIELKYIYCIRDMGDGNFTFGLDPTVIDPGEFGSPIVYTDALYKASKGTPAADSEPYTDEWGTFYSAYSPVFDSKGTVAGIVAVDFSADWYEQQLSALTRTTIIISILSLLIGALIVIAITRRSYRRIQEVDDHLDRLAANLTSGFSQEAMEALQAAEEKQSRSDDSFDALARKVRAIIDVEKNESVARQRELNDALEAAQQANVAKSIFLSNMSHEIRTPLNAIIGLDSIAMREPDLSDRTRKQLETIGVSAQHLLSLINDVLDMSRIESGKVTIKEEEFSLPLMLDQINSLLLPQCQEKGLEYDFRLIGQTRDRYYGDEVKLKQILFNILNNAIEYTPAPGKVSLHVENISHFGDQNTLRFTVKDTGIGMDPDFLPRIFDSFSQENITDPNKSGSTGLGLAICKNLVDLMNGEITVESKKGEGSIFRVDIPLRGSDLDKENEGREGKREGIEEAEKAEKGAVGGSGAPGPVSGDGPAADTEAGTKAEVDLAGRRLLVVEDLDINAEILMDLLDLEDMESERAENGQIGADMFARSEPGYYDAILMDMRMPVMDGLEATRTIRAMDRPDAEDIPIIAVTANAFDEDVQRSMQAGLNAHLSKPVQADLLYDTLRELIRT